MLRCGECGYAYCGESKHKRYRYYRHSRMGKHRARTLPADLVEETVWGAIKEILLNPSTLWEGYKAREAEVTKQKTRLIQRLETVLNLRDKDAARLDALTKAYLDPDIGMPKAEYARCRRDIEKEITDWEREAQEIQRRLEAEAITQERMQAIEEFAAEVAQGIELVDFEEKQKVLRMLQVSGKVYTDDEQPWIELEGLFPPTEVGLSSTTSRYS